VNKTEQTEKDKDLKAKLLLRQWEIASELHRHMDNMAWQRFNYFTAINGVLLAGLGTIVTSSAFCRNPRPCLISVMTIVMPVIGAVVSWVWFFIQRRGKQYHHFRCDQAEQTEKNEALKVGGEQVLTLYKERLPGIATHSLMCVLAGFFAVSWSVSAVLLACFLFRCDY
jgi:membrane protein YqaA with SNARE-associated domain